MNKSIVRQIVDIQAQAERLISNKADLTEIEGFAKYNDEIKSFLISNIKDDIILKFVQEIPHLNIDEVETQGGFLDVIVQSLNSIGYTYYRERRKSDVALDIIRDIRGKYASIEFMIKNYFNS